MVMVFPTAGFSGLKSKISWASREVVNIRRAHSRTRIAITPPAMGEEPGSAKEPFPDRPSVSFPFYHASPLHHKPYPLKSTYFLERILIRRNDVRKGSWTDLADLTFHVEQFCGDGCGGVNGLHGGHAPFDHEGEFPCLNHSQPVEAPCIRSECDFHVGLSCFCENHGQSFQHGLVHRISCLCAPFCDIICNGDRRTPIHSLCHHRPYAVVVKRKSMVDRRHASFNRVQDAVPSHCVSGDLLP